MSSDRIRSFFADQTLTNAEWRQVEDYLVGVQSTDQKYLIVLEGVFASRMTSALEERVLDSLNERGFGAKLPLSPLRTPAEEARVTFRRNPTSQNLEFRRLAELVGYTSSTVTVGVADSGFDATHPLLRGKLIHGLADEDQVRDYHGTRTATRAARGTDRIRLSLASTFVDEYNSDPVRAVREVAERGAVIVNISLQARTPRKNAELLEIIDAHPDTLFVFAAGNDGEELSATNHDLQSLALHSRPNLLVVAGTTQSGRRHPKSNAGEGVVNLADRFVALDASPEGFVWDAGTSFAAPEVTNTAALLFLLGSFSPRELKALVEVSAEPPRSSDEGVGLRQHQKSRALHLGAYIALQRQAANPSRLSSIGSAGYLEQLRVLADRFERRVSTAPIVSRYSGKHRVSLGGPGLRFSTDAHRIPYADRLRTSVFSPGAGSFVSTGEGRFVVTVGHVAQKDRIELEVEGVDGEMRSVQVDRRLRLHTRWLDLAVYEVEGEPLPKGLSNSTGIQDSSHAEFWAIGFPSAYGRELVASPLVRLPPVKKVIAAPNINTQPAEAWTEPDLGADEWLTFRGDVGMGNSGGPVVAFWPDREPTIVGLVEGGLGLDGDQVRVVSMAEIRTLLERYAPKLGRQMGFLTLPKGKAAPPTLPDIGARSAAVFPEPLLVSDRQIDDVEFTELEFAPGTVFRNASFRNVTFGRVDFSQVRFDNVTFENTVFSDDTQWPEGFLPDSRKNLGPVSLGSTNTRDFSSKQLDGIRVWLDLVGANFDDTSLRGARIRDVGGSTSFRGADLRNATLFVTPGESLPDFTGADLRGATLWGAQWPPELEHQSEQDSGLRVALQFQSPVELSDSLLSAYAPKAWSETERVSVESAIRAWRERLPGLLRRLDGRSLHLLRVEETRRFRGDPPYLATPESVKSRRVFDFSPAMETFPITLTDRNFGQGLETDAWKLALLSQLVAVVLTTRDPRPPVHYFSASAGISRKERRQRQILLDDAWSHYQELRQAGRLEEADRYDREFARAYGYPSIYALRANRPEALAELVAYRVLDSEFSEYASPELVEFLDTVVPKTS